MASATETAAWWGATVATIVLVWDVYKWFRAGPLVRVRANPNMQDLNAALGRARGDMCIFLDVTNSGDRPTTITHLVVYHYRSLLDRWRRKHSCQAVVGDGNWGPPTPYVLRPGERWTSGVNQADLIRKVGSTGYVYCGVIHSSGKRPILARLKMEDLKSA